MVTQTFNDEGGAFGPSADETPKTVEEIVALINSGAITPTQAALLQIQRVGGDPSDLIGPPDPTILSTNISAKPATDSDRQVRLQQIISMFNAGLLTTDGVVQTIQSLLGVG